MSTLACHSIALPSPSSTCNPSHLHSSSYNIRPHARRSAGNPKTKLASRNRPTGLVINTTVPAPAFALACSNLPPRPAVSTATQSQRRRRCPSLPFPYSPFVCLVAGAAATGRQGPVCMQICLAWAVIFL
ncbi:hypothetical protein GALMADRAFT_250990 [Galerina marginata CBS 339.88]|uniref:Uncharacterized protein n=1 Tax=Galerina marginata (strain CBS 339.88) TaxID=685588 RepID=A0A067ST64_GALM3|nr:hypothetical protein GALMADRAFT_250990 [Galerina marginata CBS 339.88]